MSTCRYCARRITSHYDRWIHLTPTALDTDALAGDPHTPKPPRSHPWSKRTNTKALS